MVAAWTRFIANNEFTNRLIGIWDAFALRQRVRVNALLVIGRLMNTSLDFAVGTLKSVFGTRQRVIGRGASCYGTRNRNQQFVGHFASPCGEASCAPENQSERQTRHARDAWHHCPHGATKK